jgi:hypothetical protein
MVKQKYAKRSALSPVTVSGVRALPAKSGRSRQWCNERPGNEPGPYLIW